jgi:hypothetical protein
LWYFFPSQRFSILPNCEHFEQNNALIQSYRESHAVFRIDCVNRLTNGDCQKTGALTPLRVPQANRVVAQSDDDRRAVDYMEGDFLDPEGRIRVKLSHTCVEPAA